MFVNQLAQLLPLAIFPQRAVKGTGFYVFMFTRTSCSGLSLFHPTFSPLAFHTRHPPRLRPVLPFSVGEALCLRGHLQLLRALLDHVSPEVLLLDPAPRTVPCVRRTTRLTHADSAASRRRRRRGRRAVDVEVLRLGLSVGTGEVVQCKVVFDGSVLFTL